MAHKHPLLVVVLVVHCAAGLFAQTKHASASGGVWKTENAGTSWTPILDDQGSYSIGFVTLDPRNPHTVWVGTGENNNQRALGYGDGVYKSLDGGRTWTAVLAISEHTGVADLVMDPRDPDVLLAAAHQRRRHVWTYISGGPESAIYKTTDGGATWRKVTSGLPAISGGSVR